MSDIKDSVQADLNKHFSRYEDPLWDEECPIDPVYEIKISSTKKTITWKLLKDKKTVLILNKSELPQNIADTLFQSEGLQKILKLFKKLDDKITQQDIVKELNANG